MKVCELYVFNAYENISVYVTIEQVLTEFNLNRLWKIGKIV